MTSRDVLAESDVPTRPLRRDPPFLRYWIAHTISVTGTSISMVALPVLVYQRTGSASLTSLIATAQFLPYVCFGLLAGAVADRVDRGRLMVAMDLANLVLLASIPVAALVGPVQAWHVVLVSFLSSTAFVWFDAADFGAVPALAGRARLVQAMGSLSAATTTADIAGPAVAGLLIAAVGAAQTVAVDAVSYAISALLLLTVARYLRGPTAATEGTGRPLLLADVLAGLRYVWHNRLLRALTLATSGMSITGGAVFGLVIVYAVRALHIPADSSRIGLLLTAGAIGSLAASLLLARLSRRLPVGRLIVAGLTVNLGGAAALAAAPTFGAALAAIVAFDAGYSVVTLTAITARQLMAQPEMTSRVNTTGRLIAVAGRPIGAALGGAIASVLPVRTAVLTVAAGTGVSLVYALVSALRKAGRQADIRAVPREAGRQ